MLLRVARDDICIYQKVHIAISDMEHIDCIYDNFMMLESETEDNRIVKEVNIHHAKTKEKS